MRKSQVAVILNMIKEDRVAWLFRQAAKLPLVHLSCHFFRGVALNSPIMATIIPTSRCNLDCRFCGIKRGQNGDISTGEEFTPSELLTIVEQLADMGVSGIGFSGGEPLLHKGTIPAIGLARKLGVSVTLATNASCMNKEQIEDILNAGPDNITISIDSSDPSVHDKLRNTSGAYHRTKKAIFELKRAICSRRSPRIRVTVVCVICEDNVREIETIISQVREMGADAVGFIPEHYISPEGLLVPRKSRVCVGVSSMIREFSRGLQENSDWYVRSIDNVFKDGCGPVKPCSQGYTSLTIGPGGKLYACWPDYLSNRPFFTIDIKKTVIKDVWNSREYKRKRREILRCNRCFINCVAELNHLVRFW